MYFTKVLTTLSLSIFVVFCLTHLAKADDQSESIFDSSFSGASSTLNSNKAGKGRQIINPVRIIGRILEFIFNVITFPVRYPLSIVANLVATVGLLLLGCRVVPELSCPEGISAMVPDFINSMQEEMEYYASFVGQQSDG